MNFPEMIYKVTTFMFSNAWIYFGFLLLIITVRGDVTKALKGIGGFFKKVRDNYRRLTTKPTDPKEKQKIELNRK